MVVPVLALRVVLLALGAVTDFVDPVAPDGLPDWLLVWHRWDAGHYLTIAADGYDPAGDLALSAFLPFYPALIRVGSLVLPPLVAAMTISLVATLAASLGLYALALADGGDRALARRAVLAMNLFPTSFVLVGAYSEAVFLAVSIGALLAARLLAARRLRWAGAGVLGLMATLTRVQGWLLAPVLLVEYLGARGGRLRRGRLDWLGWGVLWVLVVGLGPLAFLAVNQLAYGDPLFFLGQQADHFHHRLAPPWEVIGDLVTGVVRRDDALWAMVSLAPLVGYAVLTLVSVWALVSRRSRPAYATFALLALVTLASVTWPISVPRYVGAIFPVFLAMADVGRREWLWVPMIAASAALLLAFTIVFVNGGWAF